MEIDRPMTLMGSVIHCVTVSLRKRLGFINGDVVSRMGVKVLQEGQLASHYYELHMVYGLSNTLLWMLNVVWDG